MSAKNLRYAFDFQIKRMIKKFLIKYKYIIFSLNILAIINFFHFFYLHDMFSYIGFFLHLGLFFFYVKNFKIFSFNSRKLFLFFLILLFLIILSGVFDAKLNYSFDEEIIFFRSKRIIFLLVFFSFFLILKSQFARVYYKRIISKLVIFFIILLLYLSWGNTLVLIDIIYPTTISYKLLYYGNLHLNEFARVVNLQPKEMLLPGVKLLQGIDGNFYPIFPLFHSIATFFILILLKLLCIPFASLKLKLRIDFFLLNDILEFYELFQFQKVVACIISFISVLLFYHFLKNLKLNISNKKLLFYTVLYSLGSIHWSISASNLWQHTYIEFFNLIILVFLYKFFKKELPRYLLIIGAIQGLLFYIRPTTIFISFVIFIFIIYYIYNRQFSKNNLITTLSFWLLGYIVAVLPLLYLNLKTHGNPIGGYYSILFDKESKDVEFAFVNYTNHFLGILFSPNFGIFSFHPYFLIAIILFVFYRKSIVIKKSFLKSNKLIYASCFVIILYILFYSSNVQWTGFYNYGTRMMADILVYMFFVFIFFLEKIKFSLGFFPRFLIILTYVVAFWIQFYGTYSQYLLGDWYCDVHKKIDYHEDIEKKIWDFKDNVFLHRIVYRSQPVFKENTYYNGNKICASHFATQEGSSLVFDTEKVFKLKVSSSNPKNISTGDLLFYYYFFIDKKHYDLNFRITNLDKKVAELKIYIKKSNTFQEFNFVLLPDENIISIPIEGLYFQERVFFYAFSNKYTKVLLSKIEIVKK